jgi:anti-sigma B factor antagonist
MRSVSVLTNQDRSAITALETAVWQTGRGSAIVVLSGDLDLATVPKLRERLADLVDCDVIDLVIDIANLEFIDSSGISAIVMTLEHVRSRGGSLVLRNANPMAMKIFEITGLKEHLSVTGCADLTTMAVPRPEVASGSVGGAS